MKFVYSTNGWYPGIVNSIHTHHTFNDKAVPGRLFEAIEAITTDTWDQKLTVMHNIKTTRHVTRKLRNSCTVLIHGVAPTFLFSTETHTRKRWEKFKNNHLLNE